LVVAGFAAKKLSASMALKDFQQYRAVATKEPQREGGHGTFRVVYRGPWYPSYQQAMEDGLRYKEKHPDVHIQVEENQDSNLSAGMGA